MRTLSSLAAVVALILTVAFIPVVGGVLFAMVFFGMFLLALVGVLSGLEDRTVRQHNPSMNPREWREGSYAVDARDRLDRDLSSRHRNRE